MSTNQDCTALWGATGRGRCCSSSAETKALQFLAPADDVGEKTRWKNNKNTSNMSVLLSKRQGCQGRFINHGLADGSLFTCVLKSTLYIYTPAFFV